MAWCVCTRVRCIAIRRIYDSCRSSVSIGHLLFADDVLDTSGNPKRSLARHS